MIKEEEMRFRIRRQHELSPRKNIKTANEVHAERERQVAEFLAKGGEIQVLDSGVMKKSYSLKHDWKIRGND